LDEFLVRFKYNVVELNDDDPELSEKVHWNSGYQLDMPWATQYVTPHTARADGRVMN